MLAFFLVAMCVLVSAHFYVASRIILDPGMPEPWRSLSLGFVGLLGVGLVLVPLAERLLPRGVTRVIAWPVHLTERVNELEPDLVAVTGDLVDGHVDTLFDEVAPFSGLRGGVGVYFVTGNHDHLSDAAAWVERAKQLGFCVLRNERVEIEVGAASFDLAGVDDHHGALFGAEGGEDLDAALDHRDPSRPLVLLAHDPSTFKRASRLGVDLQLSGHTHGGQIWPFGALVRLVIPWVAGHHRIGRSQLYVSRGSGFWGPPMRLFAPAEITELTLRSTAIAGGGDRGNGGRSKVPATPRCR